MLEKATPILSFLWEQWKKDDCSRKVAVISFYATLFFVPLFFFLFSLISFFVDEVVLHQKLITNLELVLGSSFSQSIERIIEKFIDQNPSSLVTTVSALVFFFSSTKILSELDKSLKDIFEIKTASTLKESVLNRFFLFGVIVLLVSLLGGATFFMDFFLNQSGYLHQSLWLVDVFSLLITILLYSAVLMVLFGLVKVAISWKGLLVGSVLISLFMLLGNVLLTLYLRNAAISTVYGTAGAFLILMIWIYYSVSVLFVGAQMLKYFHQRSWFSKTVTRVSNLLG